MFIRLIFIVNVSYCFLLWLCVSESNWFCLWTAEEAMRSLESVPDLEKSMYMVVDGYPCVRLLNLSGEIGCSSKLYSRVHHLLAVICFIRIFGKLTFFLRLCFESWKTSKKRKAKRKKKSMIIKKLVWASKFSLIVLHFYSPLRRERKINACIIFRLDSDHVKFAGKENKEDKCKERKSEGN